MANVVECEKLEIILPCNKRTRLNDGFRTTILVDGLRPSMPERIITLVADYRNENYLTIKVEFKNGNVQTYAPKEFDFEYLDLAITKRPSDPRPLISMAKLYPAIRDLRLRFTEGEMPTVDVRLVPIFKEAI